jgi:hypothetical protein
MELSWQAIDDYFFHYYQLLFFVEPPLTEPNGRPFNLKWDAKHRHCIVVECQPWSGRREEFDFLIGPMSSDEEVLAHCRAILNAIAELKPKVNQMACCPLAEPIGCVCAYSFSCPLHGEQHIGTHD